MSSKLESVDEALERLEHSVATQAEDELAERVIEQPAERWRKQPIPDEVEHADGRGFSVGDDRKFADVTVVWDEEQIARIREGRMCLRCWEPQEEAMPPACSLCGYSMRDLQARDLEREFEGTKHLGPATTLQQEMDRLEAERERKIWTPGRSVSVPSGSEDKIWTPPDAAA